MSTTKEAVRFACIAAELGAGLEAALEEAGLPADTLIRELNSADPALLRLTLQLLIIAQVGESRRANLDKLIQRSRDNSGPVDTGLFESASDSAPII